ncbi:MAG TPA: class II fructose-bisphosphate aldolase [Patescibacteria group bacterium]|nr:class II fructose-bisphosphate aldolase [Patescibacteria group bacterium]
MLSSLPILLKKAQRQGYAVGAFNVNQLETIQAIIAAAEAEKSPVILATSEGAIAYAGMEELGALAHISAAKASIPMAFHLDHGKDDELVAHAVKSGWYGSVMYDGSAHPYEENVRRTKKIVKLAHARGVAIEAELGSIAGIEDFVSVEDRNIHLTDPDQAAEFVQQTGCDALAVAVGTAHGAYKFQGACRLDFKRLQEIAKRVRVPLVLHGASGVPTAVKAECMKYGCKIEDAKGVSDASIRKAISLGICKVNVDTDLRMAFDAGVRKYLAKNPADIDPRHILGEAKEFMTRLVRQKMRLLGSSGKV